MKEELITVKSAKLAKELGFDIPCINYYCDKQQETKQHETITHTDLLSDEYALPTQAVLLKWLREEHNAYIAPVVKVSGNWSNITNSWSTKIKWKGGKIFINSWGMIKNLIKGFPTYEQAADHLIEETLKILVNK